MIIFLYGENSYLIQKKLADIRAKFLGKYPEADLEELFADEVEDFINIKSKLEAQSLFSSKKLLILKDAFSRQSFEFRAALAEHIGKRDIDTTLIIVENTLPDKREKLFKTLIKIAKCQEFATLDPFGLSKWLKEEAELLEATITKNVADKLLYSSGSDMQVLRNEIEKLSLYAKSQGRVEVVEEDVKLLVKVKADPEIFPFVESVAAGKKRETFEILEEFYETGENENYLISMITYQYRTLISIEDLKRRGVAGEKISKEAGIHPYVLRKSLGVLRNYSWERLLKIFETISDYDSRIKSGRIDPRLGLDLLVAKLVGK